MLRAAWQANNPGMRRMEAKVAPFGVSRRDALARLAAGCAALSLGASHAWAAAPRPAAGACRVDPWPLWDVFKTQFLQPDGRVVDASSSQMHSSSEGQSYCMFFALVANDQHAFEAMWRWSVNNLLGGDVAHNLPAWHWGLAEDGTWRVLDKNSASDADLWFVYALLEAGRAWGRADYTADGRTLLANIELRETAVLPGLGKMLLPGEYSFAQANALWRLNPSYMPIPLLRRLAAASPAGGWNEVATNTIKMIQATAPKGFSPDWLAYQGAGASAGHFIVDPLKGDLGSYDAIRVYLWAGMTPVDEPLAASLMRAVSGLAKATNGAAPPPEKVVTTTGETSGSGPFGFSAALLPYLKVTNQTKLLDLQRQRVETLQKLTLLPEILQSRRPPYYDYVLTLFSLGWIERRYHFQRNGTLHLLWEETCPHVATR